MLKELVIFSVVFFYISLFIELFFYDIPSVVSTKKILNSKHLELEHFSKPIRDCLTWPLLKKIIVFVTPMVFIYALHLLPAYLLYDVLYSNEFAVHNDNLSWFSVLLVVTGRLVSHLYLMAIKRIKTKTYEGFVVDSIYKLSRNPGLLGLYISFLGFILMKPSPLFLICFLVYVFHMHFKIKMEEDYLTHKHGEDYRVYLQKTRRYL